MAVNELFRKRLFHCMLTIVLLLLSAKGFSQNAKEVSSWKTWVLNKSEINLPPPPGKEQTTRELDLVKQRINGRTSQAIQQIEYWDAGAPSYRWNQIAYALAGPELFAKQYGGNFWRAPMAWMNIAVYDATIAAWKIKYQYQRKRPSEMNPALKVHGTIPSTPSYPCEHTVTASAAAHVLAYFFPEKADSVLQLAKKAGASRIDGGLQFPSDVDEGWALGEKVAAQVIEAAKKDGSDGTWKGQMPQDPMKWKGDYPVGAVASTFKPIVLKTGDQFRPPAPPDFKGEMEELNNFKQDFHSIYQAFFWANANGLEYWTDMASQKIFEHHLDSDAPACARIYALLHVTIHDAIIAITDAKYAYFGIRPFQLSPGFKPLIGYTPPFPGYPSGHATASAACAGILAYFFPADARMFRLKAQECADSRFYAGIHFQTDNKVGLDLGAKLAGYVIETKAKMDNVGSTY